MQKQDPSKETIVQRTLNWADSPFSGNSFLLVKIHTLVRILLITAKEFSKNELNIRASALTYTILLSLVPILAMSTAVVKGLGGGDQLRQVVYSYIDTLEKTTPIAHGAIPTSSETTAKPQAHEETTLPHLDASITTHLRSATDQLFDYVDKTNFATLGTFGVLGILLSAVLVLGNIELSMNTIWHVSSGRSILRKITDYLTFLVLMPLSINFGFAANTVLKNDTLLNKVMAYLPAVWVQSALLLLVPLFFITLTLFLIYIFFPHTKVKPMPALIGALFAGTLWFITQNVYIGLQIGVSRYNAIYGSFATLPLFLVWMFLGWVFILGGAQLAFSCQRHSSYRLTKEDYSPLEQLSAALDIIMTTLDAYAGKRRLQQKELSLYCPAYSTRLLYSTLEKLISAQILLTTKKGILLPSAPADQIRYQEIITAILGKTFPHTKGGKAASALLEQADSFLNMSFAGEKQHDP
ncbi:MAG: YihY/virulence factor BrkB family protein [Proteobacteria bacterium]|nr:YihY/virulence factor BrkB family protein [Pseudomonadota bacterium]MBU1233747.1 YihY/virulence factor BrkB family protein [Pseudomonadota bacterium]MBU1419252.1 YihY/virulence factor BrkB family protein [Pseudomonadota bacterium]MBU1453880.1 YihY/virulence factor BrkB family protein [Pseudomonadota bacterium]